MGHRPSWLVAILFVAILFPLATGAPAARAEAAAASDPFPEFEAIRGNVEFWKSVYGSWSRGQVIVHDLEYPAVVYDVVDLPGPIEARYTAEQSRFVEDLNKLWQSRLKAVEKKLHRKQPLSDSEKEWALKLTDAAGGSAVDEAHERIRTQRGMRERFLRGIELSYRYDTAVREVLREIGVPETLAFLPHVESSFQAQARSSAGAVGIWQFTRGAGRRYMTINSALDDRLDPLVAARGAAKYLRDAYAALGDWPIALTSYNHGVAGMRRAAQAHGADYEQIFLNYRSRTFGFASKNFYSEFLAAKAIASEPERYFPEGFTPEPTFDLQHIVLGTRTTPASIAQAYDAPLSELAALNPAWSRRAVRSGLALPRGTTVWLPAGTLERIASKGHVPVLQPAAAVGDLTYRVRKGDTLSLVAQAHGMTLTELRDLNGIGRGRSLIRVGQKLLVHGATDARTHVVRRGETLSTIARTYRMDIATLRAINNLSGDLIRVGQELRLHTTNEKVHVVRSGDTLSKIAGLHGIAVGTLRELNAIAPGDSLIRVGQQLRVAGVPATVHVVKRGESLSRIASSYGVSLRALLKHNRLSLRSVIHPGQSLRIPLSR